MRRPLVLLLLVLVAALLAAAPASAATLPPGTLEGTAKRAGSGEALRLTGTLPGLGKVRMTETEAVVCRPGGADCDLPLDAKGCALAWSRGTMTARGGRLRFTALASVCPSKRGEVERGVLTITGTSGRLKAYRGRVPYRLRMAPANSRLRSGQQTVTASLGSELACNACKYLGQILVSTLAPAASEAEVVGATELSCQLFPEQFRGTCNVVVEAYGKQMIEAFLAGERDPADLCRVVQACASRRCVVDPA